MSVGGQQAGAMSRPPRVFSKRLLGAFPPTYLVHLIDERFWGPGTANWATANSFLYFTNEAWLWVNAPSMLAVLAVTILVSQRRIPEWAGLALGVHVGLHGVMRIGGTLAYGTVSPGAATGVALCLPLALLVVFRGWHGLPRTEVLRGLICGVLSFQPLGHLVAPPFLPPKPPGLLLGGAVMNGIHAA